MTEVTDFANLAHLDGNRIHDWQRRFRQDGNLSSDFGLGWGSVFHARLVRMAGGTVVIAGGDSGPIEYPGQDERRRDAETYLLAREAKKQHRVLDAHELRRDLLVRTRLVLDLGLAAPPTPNGTRWRDPYCGGAGVLQRKNGFVHTPCKGPVEFFDREGLLTEIHFRDSSGAAKVSSRKFLHFNRDATGELASVEDGAGDRIDFIRQDQRIVAARARHESTVMEMRYVYDLRGRLESVTRVLGSDKQRVEQTYVYDADDRLIQAGKDRFSYDAAGRVAATESKNARQTYTYKLSDDGTLASRMEWLSLPDGKSSVVQESEIDKYGRQVIYYTGDGARILSAPRTGRVLMKPIPMVWNGALAMVQQIVYIGYTLPTETSCCSSMAVMVCPES